MALFNFFKKKENDFSQMSKQDKRVFLTNDLIERMVRIEQQVSANFGKPIHFRKTKYYSNLTHNEKVSFENYLKNKKYAGLVSVLLLGLFFFSFSYSISGNVISEGVNNTENWPKFILLFFTLVFFIAFVFVHYMKQKRKKRLNKVHHLVKNLRR